MGPTRVHLLFALKRANGTCQSAFVVCIQGQSAFKGANGICQNGFVPKRLEPLGLSGARSVAEKGVACVLNSAGPQAAAFVRLTTD
eukprot:1160291-Pelagomonas_calceolata.AAC.8